MRGAYYNEHDAFAAQWLRNLIAGGHIAAGDVDERSIADVRGCDLVGYAQCHFFAGIGGWSYALRLAGVADDAPIWTGSCPCQPFSAAGKRKGAADERHLWPEFARLTGECEPAAIFGEQVASADGRIWLADVRHDLEVLGYAVGAADLCAPGAGAFHIRQRLYWGARRLADANRNGCGAGCSAAAPTRQGNTVDADGGASVCRVGNADRLGRGEGRTGEACARSGRSLSAASGLEHAARDGRDERRPEPSGRGAASGCGEVRWADAEWLECSDGKTRPIEPGTFPLAYGVPARVGRLRGYGNTIVPQNAAQFVQAWRECAP